MNIPKPNQTGSMLVEVLLSISILGLLLTTLVGAVIYTQENAVMSGTRNRATFLAEEGLEAVRNIRDANFASLTEGSHGLATPSGAQWTFSGTSDNQDVFTRAVIITTVSGNDIYVKPGNQATNIITALLKSGDTANPVYFQAVGIPEGAQFVFTPDQCLPDCSSTMTISTTENTPTGSYIITIVATAKGSATVTIPFNLIVN
jgi:type II secretory pathway pseudopilin PulG